MKILVVGPGGREHAIIRALRRDEAVTEVHALPGNAGIAAEVPCHTQISAEDGPAVAEFAAVGSFDLVVIGPEAPLAAGVADKVRETGVPVFGPSQAAAQLEVSKAFAKDVMASAQVPTAEAIHATDTNEAATALDRFGAPYVVKDDGLAAGKGVVVTSDRQAALAHAEACFASEGTVVIEQFLDGPEVSLFVLCDGENLVPLSPAQDFKRIYDNDAGPNTGGMGAYTPLDWLQDYTETHKDGVTRDFTQTVVEKVARPTLAEMARRGAPFIGVLYCGLAVTSGGIRVVEFNVRFGDPETQAVLERLATGLGGLLHEAATVNLGPDRQLEWRDGYAAAVVMAAQNYPESPRKGDPISGIAQAEAMEGVAVLHAGTTFEQDAEPTQSSEQRTSSEQPTSSEQKQSSELRHSPGEETAENDGEPPLITAGGRVLAVVGTADTLHHGVERAYAGVEKISWTGAQYRTDIAAKALAGQIRVSAQLPGWVHMSSGKVRELYAPAPGSAWNGQQVLLMVATDRISAFDHILCPGVPDKGAILHQLSLWWFDQLAEAGIGNHVVSTDVPEAVAGRAVIVAQLQMVQAEAIVRGYLTGSALEEYTSTGTVNGIELPAGLEDGSQLPEPIFTPSTKAAQGSHDENITFAQLETLLGTEQASRLRKVSLQIYRIAEAQARAAGIIVADSKFEFGIDHRGDCVLADEVLTPDSSRFWPADQWQPGAMQPSFDKQFVRNWLTSEESGWDRGSGDPPPPLPEYIVTATQQRYLEAYRSLTGGDPIL